MAYCVHCGVKLGEAESKCPLCQTEVFDPAEPFDDDTPKAYPVRNLDQTLLASRRYAITLLSVLLLIPAGLCLVIDLISGGITWSVYPAGVLVLTWMAVVVPLLMKRHRLYTTLLITGAALAGYLYMIEQLSNTEGWFLPIVFPAMALFMAMICFTVWLIRSKRLRILRLVGVILMMAGTLCLFIEWLCVRAAGLGQSLSWSPFVVIPCFFVALLLYVISRNGPLSTELKRRFHF